MKWFVCGGGSVTVEGVDVAPHLRWRSKKNPTDPCYTINGQWYLRNIISMISPNKQEELFFIGISTTQLIQRFEASYCHHFVEQVIEQVLDTRVDGELPSRKRKLYGIF